MLFLSHPQPIENRIIELMEKTANCAAIPPTQYATTPVISAASANQMVTKWGTRISTINSDVPQINQSQ
jgi:hypothetical protein